MSYTQTEHTKERINSWLNGTWDGLTGYNTSKIIRRYLINKANNKCELCGWSGVNRRTGNSCLEIHHKDGNYKHNSIDNIQVLCPNCHSMTETYRNSGAVKSSRCNRHKYSSIYHRTTPDERATKLIRIKITENSQKCKKIKERIHPKCLICGKPCLSNGKYCSHECYAKSCRKIDWDSLDIFSELKTKTVSRIAKEQGVSFAALVKHMKKMGIENPRNKKALAEKRAARDVVRQKNREREKPIAVMCVENKMIFQSKGKAAVWMMDSGITSNKSLGSVKKSISRVLDNNKRTYMGYHFKIYMN